MTNYTRPWILCKNSSSFLLKTQRPESAAHGKLSGMWCVCVHSFVVLKLFGLNCIYSGLKEHSSECKTWTGSHPPPPADVDESSVTLLCRRQNKLTCCWSQNQVRKRSRTADWISDHRSWRRDTSGAGLLKFYQPADSFYWTQMQQLEWVRVLDSQAWKLRQRQNTIHLETRLATGRKTWPTQMTQSEEPVNLLWASMWASRVQVGHIVTFLKDDFSQFWSMKEESFREELDCPSTQFDSVRSLTL